jgi:sirohydrochlorin ferrochelatase
MDAIVLFSHGSLLCGAGEALRAHAERLRAQGLTPMVTVGYLNFSEPPFLDAVAECVAAGATRIFVTPYFLAPGYFVKVDLPKAVAEAQARFPELEFVVAEAIGFDERLADALIESANRAVGPEGWREDLKRASEFCRPSSKCPLFGTLNCPKQPVPLPDLPPLP